MRIRKLIIQFSGAIALSTAFELIYGLYQYYSKRNTIRSSKPLYEVLFFPDSQVACQVHFTVPGGCTDANCWYAHDATALMKLKQSLDKAKKTIDICVYTITSQDLGDAVVSLSKRGVYVRVITDDEQVDTAGSQVGKFRAAGIEVRHDNSSFFMHHKFAIIDDSTLINGSFNWSRQAIFGNNENVFITDDPNIVSKYVHEFIKLWDIYDPARRLGANGLLNSASGQAGPPAAAAAAAAVSPGLGMPAQCSSGRVGDGGAACSAT